MKVFTGKVISTKMAKTATVAVTHIVIHPVYLKRQKKTRKYQVHDDLGVKIGETVKFVATKPYSKMKKWKIVKERVVAKKWERQKGAKPSSEKVL